MCVPRRFLRVLTRVDFSHHYQTSALLSKISSGRAETIPVLPSKKRKSDWWSKRAEAKGSRRVAPAHGTGPLLGHTSSTGTKSSSKRRSCLSSFGSTLLRQPWVPTQPLTVLFTFLLIGCFVATLTTFLVHVLSTDKQPLPWRTFCQEQRPFPHALADSLAPVNVFVGVFSVDAAYERRHLIRSTYARHSKAIDPRTGQPGQNVQVRFILGRPRQNHARRIALEMEMYNDVVVLDIKENMNRGKTHAYFKWASENATVPVYYERTGGEGGVAVGFQKADYVVKADDDAFLVLSELERHLRVSPREKTYWGCTFPASPCERCADYETDLIRNLFMAGEAYALSADLVQYVATYEPLLAYTAGAEDKRVAKWMRMHPSASTLNWVTERCWMYDHPKAGTTYAHGFLFPQEVERIRLEGRVGLQEEERVARGGDASQSFSTVSKWKEEYGVPLGGMTIEEEVEALVEGGGRWHAEEFTANGDDSVRWDSIVFETNDPRLQDSRRDGDAELPSTESTGVVPGVPDRRVQLPSGGRTTKFGKDLFRDPSDVEAVQITKRGEEDSPTTSYHNSVIPPSPEPEETSLPLAPPLPSSITSSTPPVLSPLPPNLPTNQIRLPAHNYILPPFIPSRLVSPPTLRFDPTTQTIRQRRMMNRPYGGTVAVHFLKRNEWFLETSLALLGREQTWDFGLSTPSSSFVSLGAPAIPIPNSQISRLPLSSSSSTALGGLSLVPAHWGGARMYGSPIVREDGYISEGRIYDRREETVSNEPLGEGLGRLGRLGRTGGVALGFRVEEGVEVVLPREAGEERIQKEQQVKDQEGTVLPQEEEQGTTEHDQEVTTTEVDSSSTIVTPPSPSTEPTPPPSLHLQSSEPVLSF